MNKIMCHVNYSHLTLNGLSKLSITDRSRAILLLRFLNGICVYVHVYMASSNIATKITVAYYASCLVMFCNLKEKKNGKNRCY